MSSGALAIVVLVGLWALLRSESGRGLVLVILGVVVWVSAPFPFAFLGFVLVAAGIAPAVAGGGGLEW